ncbi:MAG: hypothetical protein CMN30_19840 [Sandaracinus sp.]|nr:hypothetical protein [Sandaracinus sp.]|tara:strand:- start:202 stop:636 length:435 start_codon:yes stop_codon:yes gene_type:complete
MGLSRDEIIARAAREVGASPAVAVGDLAREAVAHPAAHGDVALVDVTRVDPRGRTDGPPVEARRVVGLTLAFDACVADALAGVAIHRLIGPFGVVDVRPEGLVVVEVALGVSAKDLQERSTAPIQAGPSLGPVRLTPDAGTPTL